MSVENACGEASSSTDDSDKDLWFCRNCDKNYKGKAGLRRHYSSKHNSCEGHECPTCGQSNLVNERGVKLHHSKAHGESLVENEVNCEYCGSEVVKSDFEIERSNNNFCSLACHSKWMKSELHGEKHPLYKPDSHEIRECEYCGSEFKHKIKKHAVGRFCSRVCKDSHLSTLPPEKTPNWKGGDSQESINYGPSWKKQREKAKERDSYTCQDCGVAESEVDYFDVHHIQPFRTFNDHINANRLNNLISLCRACHHKWEGIPLRPQVD